MATHTEKLPISVFVVTLNEEHNIERMLKSCVRLNEIILVDCGSTDATLELAARYGAKIFHHEWQGYAKQKQYALEQCQNEWVLNLDADEELNDKLIDQFVHHMNSGKVAGVRCKREDVFMGKRRSSLTKKANNLRFYKKSKVAFDEKTLVHETAHLNGTEISVNGVLTHYGYNNFDSIITKNNKYSSLKALEKFQKGKRFSYLKLAFISPLVFLQAYILHGYVFSGMRGLILARALAFYAFSKEAKLYGLYKNTLDKSNLT